MQDFHMALQYADIRTGSSLAILNSLITVGKKDIKLRYREIIENSNPESIFDAQLNDMIWDISALANRPEPDKRQVMKHVMQLLQYARTKGRGSYAVKAAVAHIKKMQKAFAKTIPELMQLGDLSKFETE